MTKDEALALALEALERVSLVDNDCDILSPQLADLVEEAIIAITAIKQAQQAQEPVQSEHELIKAFLHKHRASALPDGACECCEGEGEIGGQFIGKFQVCPDCNGSGKAAPKQAKPNQG